MKTVHVFYQHVKLTFLCRKEQRPKRASCEQCSAEVGGSKPLFVSETLRVVILKFEKKFDVDVFHPRKKTRQKLRLFFLNKSMMNGLTCIFGRRS